MSKRVALTPQSVDHTYEIVRAIPQEFAIIFHALRRRKAFGNADLTEAARLLPDFEHFGYRLQYPVIKLRGTQKNRFDCTDILHEGMHQLFCLRYGDAVKGRPHLSLLNECCGMGLDLYIASACYRAFGKASGIAGFRLNLWEANSKRLKIPYRKYFDEALRDSYLAYKKTVREFFSINRLLLQHLEKHYFENPLSHEEFCQKLEKHPRHVLMFRLVNIKPVLYCATYCGFRSSKLDQELTEQCLNALDRSRSMLQFMRHLEGVR